MEIQTALRQFCDYSSYIRGFSPATISRYRSILFLPKAVLRDLPVAQSFEEIGDAAAFNDELRRRYNALLAPIMDAPKSERKKSAIKDFLFEDPERLKVVTESYGKVDPTKARYDFDSDPAGEDYFYEGGKELAVGFPEKEYPQTEAGLRSIVGDVVSHFKRCVEAHGAWELLLNDDHKPRKERSAQLLFLSMALGICPRFNVDVLREPSGGRGALDFKFFRQVFEVEWR